MPKAVTNLKVAELNTTAVYLTWLRQDDHKSDYSYEVTVLQEKDIPIQFKTNTENYTFTSLTPGVNYTFQVSTVVHGVKSTVETTSSYTGMSLKLALDLSVKDVSDSVIVDCSHMEVNQMQRSDLV